jgi:hypothetical protein
MRAIHMSCSLPTTSSNRKVAPALAADAEIRRVALEEHVVGSVLQPWESMKPSEED